MRKVAEKRGARKRVCDGSSSGSLGMMLLLLLVTCCCISTLAPTCFADAAKQQQQRHQSHRRLQGQQGGADTNNNGGGAIANLGSMINNAGEGAAAEVWNEIEEKLPKPPPPTPKLGVFGTDEGYDVGGSQAMCWESSYDAARYYYYNASHDGDGENEHSSSSDDASSSGVSYFTNHLDELQDYLFEEREKTDPVQLLSSCYNGTSLTITPLDLEEQPIPSALSSAAAAGAQTTTTTSTNNVMYLGQPYTFRLRVEMDIESLVGAASDVITDMDAITIYCRLHACHAEFQGFCNPLIDTREQDKALTSRAQTDVGADESDVFANDNTKWSYKAGTPLKGLLRENKYDVDDDTKKKKHTSASAAYTRWIQWKLRRVSDSSFVASVDMALQLPAVLPVGAYFVVGHVVVDYPVHNNNNNNNNTTTTTTNDTTTTTTNNNNTTDNNNYWRRVDISQTIPDKVVQVRREPKILTATTASKIWLSIAIAITGAWSLYCLGFVYRHRRTHLMKLAQGGLLGAMAAACCVQTVFTFSYLPVQDVFCRLRGPLVHVPLTFVGAILVGRVWRIYTTLGAANALGKQQQPNKSTGNGSSSTGGSSSSSSKKSLALSRRTAVVEVAFVKMLDGMASLFVGFGDTTPRKWSCCCGSSTEPSSPTAGSRRRQSRIGFRRVVTPKETYGLIFLLTLPQLVFQIVASIVLTGGLETEYDASGNVGRVVCAVEGKWVHMTGTAIAAVVYICAVFMAYISRDLPSAFNEKDQIFHAAAIATILEVMAIALGVITDEPTTEPDVAIFLWSCVSLGIVLSVLWLIIWPKVRRLKSGDKVVVSSLLGSRYSAGLPKLSSTDSPSESIFPNNDHTTAAATSPLSPNNTTSARKRTHVRPDDPIPGHIESTILEVQSILRNVTAQSGDGRPLSKEEWLEMRGEVAKLKAHLDLIDLDPSGTEEAARQSDCSV